MKHTVALFCLLLMLTQAPSPQKMSDREQEGFRGPVMKVFDERFPSGSISIGSDGKPYSKDTYSAYEVNPRGDWIKRREIQEHLNQPDQAKTTAIVTRTIEYY
jgi:hypothetical protein